MKTKAFFNWTLSLSLALLAACGQTPPPADTTPPTVTLASSASSINTPSTLTLTATASDNIAVAKVEFFEDQNKLGEDTTAPFSHDIALSAANNGSKKYSAKAFDAAGNFSSSPTISVSVSIATSGSMQLSFPGLFDSIPPNVLVRGPGGFEQRITSIQASFLSNLAPGLYTITAEAVREIGSSIDFVLEGKGGEFEVKAGAVTQVQVSYSPRGGTGLLWVPVFGDHKLSGFLPFFGASPLKTAIGTGSNAFPDAVVFDRSGNLWASNSKGDSIFKYEAAQLTTSGTPTPALVLNDKGGSLKAPIGLAFDKDGGLWVANNDGNSVVRFSPDQLSASGNPVPNITLKSNNNNSLSAPVGLAFDAQGGLWVSNGGGPTVVKFAPEQLATTGNPTPAVTITGTVAVVGGAGPSLSKPHGLAFDKDGSLWVANLSADTLVRYSPQQLSISGSPTPAVTIKSDNLKGPAGLAFDNQGGLWVTNATSHALVRLPASDLVTSGTIAGVEMVADLGASETALPAFSPAPANLPINQ